MRTYLAAEQIFSDRAPERIAKTRPHYVLVLPWNLREEIRRQLGYLRSWGGRLVFPVPVLETV